MRDTTLSRTRRRIGYALVTLAVAWPAWAVLPGLPVWRAPRASAATKAAGLALFEHEWRANDPLAKGDGLGPVFNGKSCVECHFQGGVGGGGANQQNVLTFVALPTPSHREVKGGLIHKAAVSAPLAEETKILQKLFPVVPNGIEIRGVCFTEHRDFNPVHTDRINTTALFGAGWIDRISGKSITNRSLTVSVEKIGRELQADFGGVPPGRVRILPDGRVGKFGWKAQFATLEEFVAAACANEIGLGNPRMAQAKPIGHESYPDVTADLDRAQFRSLVAFVDTIPRPELVVPDDAPGRAEVEHGQAVFEKIGCAICHTPEIGGLAGVYSDFLLHRLDDRERGSSYTEVPAVALPREHPLLEEWKTPPLWGVADSAPYFHDGGAPTLPTAILRHQGDAQNVTDLYKALPAQDREALHRFLQSLRAPANAKPVAPSTVAMAR